MRFSGRVVVIAGPPTAGALALTEAFAREEARVVVAGPEPDIVTSSAARFVRADVADAAEVGGVVGEVADRFGRIDAWVNVVVAPRPSAAVEIAPLDWDRGINGILSPVFHAARRVGPVMIEQGAGSIVNVTSVHGQFAQQGGAVLCTASAAVLMLTKVLASEWGRHGVRVNAVAPVPTAQELGAGDGGPEPRERRYLSRLPIGRLPRATEIAEAVLFLAGEEASFVTGEVVRVDGGWAAYHLFYPFEEAF